MIKKSQNLKEWRKSKGWRQEDLADKLKEPRPTYQAWESGRTPFPPQIREQLKKLGYTGPWPHESAVPQEVEDVESITRELGVLRADLEDACEVIRYLLTQLPAESRPGVLPKRFR